MFKRLCVVMMCVGMLIVSTMSMASCVVGTKKEAIHVGVVTGVKSEALDHWMAVDALKKKYGDADNGGMIKHVVLEVSDWEDPNKVSDKIFSLAEDPNMEVIVVCYGFDGTSDGFNRVKEVLPGALCFVVDTLEDSEAIEHAADLIVDADTTNTGYLIPWVAKQLGAKNFIHISFDRHLRLENVALRRIIMKAACEKYKIHYYDKFAPDPIDEEEEYVLKYVADKMEKWVEEYGKDTAFFCTNNLHTDEVVKKVAELGAIFVQQDLPSPTMGYQKAFNLDIAGKEGNYKALLSAVEEQVANTPGNGRMGTWAYSYDNATAYSLAEYGIRMKKASEFYKTNLDTYIDCLDEISNVHWNVFFSYNPLSRTPKKNRVEIYQDTYILNKGLMNMSKVVIPNLFDLSEDYIEEHNESTDPERIFANMD